VDHCSCAVELRLPAIFVWVVCRLRGWRELWSVCYCAQCCGFCICWRLFEPLPLRTGYRSHCASFGWRLTRGHCWSFWAFLTGMFGGSWCWMACCIPIALPRYVQMGRSIALYTVSLLSRDNCERASISQLMFLSLSSSWHSLASMCVFYVRFSSRWSPRYFTSFFDRYGSIVEIYWRSLVSSR